ncbi:unnamed protein product [Blepharisma stoltei]|uniref:Glutamine cyclotransferase n=1 Tax=Blepharisma stoltei TaxID=1481888 RepID=A0AAU9J7A0_9CILI|nr:unnamed protein product [Blepharisma stoltei]
MAFVIYLLLSVCLISAQESIIIHGYKIVNTFPHSSQDFTQGFLIKGSSIYQSTGLYGKSELQQLDLLDNSKIKSKPLTSNYFGEGLTDLNSKLYQLTWKESNMMVYDIETFNLIETVQYPDILKEGWGICSDGSYLYISDGSNKIYVMDPEDYSIIRTIFVTSLGNRIAKINELEWIDGEIWGNIWYEHYIIRIDPSTGNVNSWVNLNGIDQVGEYNSWNGGDVLNGIAYNTGNIYVTGKRWNHIYQIELEGTTISYEIPIHF